MKQTMYSYVVMDVSGQERWIVITEKEAQELYKKLSADLHAN
jgi:hypothetical protein